MSEQESVIINAALRLSSLLKIGYDEAVMEIRKHTGYPADRWYDKDLIDASHKRLTWDEYFMSLAYLVAMRSPDAQTQHGCVIVDANNRIVSTGYNGFLQGAVDATMPNLRPQKYKHIIHSEVNAILSARTDLTNCALYVTGVPCNECLKVIARVGIKNIVIGDRPHVYAEGFLPLQCLICAMHGIEIRKFAGTLASMDGRKIPEKEQKNAPQN